jgi:hypothetical protein
MDLFIYLNILVANVIRKFLETETPSTSEHLGAVSILAMQTSKIHGKLWRAYKGSKAQSPTHNIKFSFYKFKSFPSVV